MTRPMPLLDLGFLLIERPETPSNVGALLLFEPPPGRPAASAADRIARAYRAARPGPPFDSVPDLSVLALPTGDLPGGGHAAARPAGKAGCARRSRATVSHVAQLHETPLERTRPLFSVHVIDGLASGQLAVYFKSHHAYWDGRYALERVFGQLRREPGAITPPFFAGSAGPAPATEADGLAAASPRACVRCSARHPPRAS